MWYLQVDTLLLMLGLALVFALGGILAERFRPKWRVTPWLIIADLLLLVYVSKQLAVFYTAYVLGSYLLVFLLFRVKKCRRGMFVLFCLLDISPFFYVRATAFAPSLPVFVSLIGFSYNMLKAVDALFYVYYAKQKISLLPYANFLLFFPVVTAGPIFRYRDFQKFYEAPALPTLETASLSVKRLLRGLFKKLVLIAWLQYAMQHTLTLGTHFYTSLALVFLSYAILYVDLSGYSDIAIAVGAFTGITVPENFKNPLTAASFTQFWRKWHVTLSDWIREHIFVVVNGKRLNKYISALIGLLTMIIMGLWHSFSRMTLLTSLYLGAFLVIENLCGLTTVDRRHAKKGLFYLRCVLVTFFFGINAMAFLLDSTQICTVLGGFLKL